MFSPVLQYLHSEMQKCSIVAETYRKTLSVLFDLTDIRYGPFGNVRPIATLITNQVRSGCFNRVMFYKFFILF